MRDVTPEAPFFSRPTPLERYAAVIFAAPVDAALFCLGQERAIERILAGYDLLGAREVCVAIETPVPLLTDLLNHHKTRWTKDALLERPVGEFFRLTAPLEGVFVHPATAPLASPDTLAALALAYAAARAAGEAVVAVPDIRGRLGWPWLAPSDFPAALLTGASTSPDALGNRVIRVPVEDQGAALSLLTLKDQTQIKALALAEPVPDRALCRRLLAQAAQPARRVAHCHRVAAIGLRLARALNAAGLALDSELVYAAGLFHDVAKGQKGHHLAGARIARGLGFFQTGHIVVSHTEIYWRVEDGLSETALLFLADKLVKGVTLMGVEQRFRYWLDELGEDTEDRRILIRRLKTARAIHDAIERALEQPLMEFLRRAPKTTA